MFCSRYQIQIQHFFSRTAECVMFGRTDVFSLPSFLAAVSYDKLREPVHCLHTLSTVFKLISHLLKKKNCPHDGMLSRSMSQ